MLFSWLREIAGWLLVLIGLYFCLFCLAMIETKKVIEAAIPASIGVFVFRGGIHLIKVATAARVVLSARKFEREDRKQASANVRQEMKEGVRTKRTPLEVSQSGV